MYCTINLNTTQYNKYKKNYSTVNIEPERILKQHELSIKLDLHVYDFVKNIKFEASVFREAYINQRKKYRLLKAYIDLNNDLISESDYDKIEDECMIIINDFNEDICLKAIYTFLKNHDTYVDEYEKNELSELLGISYSHVDKILKKRTNYVKRYSKISCK